MDIVLNSENIKTNYNELVNSGINYKKINLFLIYDIDLPYIDSSIDEITNLLSTSCNLNYDEIFNITKDFKEELLDTLALFYMNTFIYIKNYDDDENLHIDETFTKYEDEIMNDIYDSTVTLYLEMIKSNKKLNSLLDYIGVGENADKIDLIHDSIMMLVDSILNVYSIVKSNMNTIDMVLKDIFDINNFNYIIPHKRYFIENDLFYKVKQNILIVYR